MRLIYKKRKRAMLSGRHLAVAVVLLTGIFCFSNVMAQNMMVKESSGTMTSYALKDIASLSFSDGSLTVTKSDNSTGSYTLSSLDKLSFGDVDTRIQLVRNDVSENLSVYPNPAGNLINIDLSENNGNSAVVQLINLSGQMVQSVQVNQSGVISMDISSLSRGVYVCRYINGSEIKTVKVIKK